MSPSLVQDVLAFWFTDRARGLWFATDTQFDDEIRERFGGDIAAVAHAARDPGARMKLDAEGALAATIVLDQFPRNVHRGSARAFENDDAARAVADEAIGRALDSLVALDRRTFFYLPFQHSESLADQQRSVALFTQWVQEHPPADRIRAADEMVWALRHQVIIQRFGRFPHRNVALGRPSTAAELAFLQEAGSSF